VPIEPTEGEVPVGEEAGAASEMDEEMEDERDDIVLVKEKGLISLGKVRDATRLIVIQELLQVICPWSSS
jgi:hypothetical protein